MRRVDELREGQPLGPRDDGFYVDLGGVFDLATLPTNGLGRTNPTDGVAGYNCHSIVMQLPIRDIANRNFNANNPGAASSIVLET